MWGPVQPSSVAAFFLSHYHPPLTFTGSSLVRHIKNKCNKNQSQRRKPCSQCVANKARCSLARPTCSRCAKRNIACEYASPVMEQPEQPASPGVASAGLGLDLDIMPSFQARGLSSIFDASLFEPFFDLESWSPQLPSELVMQPQPSMEGRELLPFGRQSFLYPGDSTSVALTATYLS
jgi:hypothetical protein